MLVDDINRLSLRYLLKVDSYLKVTQIVAALLGCNSRIQFGLQLLRITDLT